MEVLHPHCAGLDIHKDSVVACVRHMVDGKVTTDGLVRPSFVPDEPTQQMRDLLRARKQFVRERTGHTQRIQKTLEDANIKLDSVISNIVGISGRRMIEALIDGQAAPEALAALAHGRLQATPAELEAALRGRVTAHHRFMLRLHLDHLNALEPATARIDNEDKG